MSNNEEQNDQKFWAVFDRVMGRKFAGQLQSADSIEEWDSLKHVELVFELEQAFDIEFNPDEIAELYSNTDVVLDLIGKKVGN